MRVMYVAPRYHTNQVPVVKGWLENGHEVMFLSQFASTPEDYSILKPVILGYSAIFELGIKILKRFSGKEKWTESKEYALRVKIGFPSFDKMKRYICQWKPDIVILRERCIYNIPVYQYCKKKKITCILYNQSPLWDGPERDNGLGHRMMIRCLPKWRMTPVMGNPGGGHVKTSNAVFVPFVMEPHIAPSGRNYFKNGKVQVLCVGSYEERKNHVMLLDVVKKIISQYELHLTIIGQADSIEEKAYLIRLEKKVRDEGMEEEVTLLKNMDMSQMHREYAKADLFVLPSTRERASVSQLEAMSCSVAVICSDTNGSACYVEDGKNGYLFQDSNKTDLEEKIRMAIKNKEALAKMGEESYRLVKEKYGFINYYNGIMSILQKETIEKAGVCYDKCKNN